ncbi:zinc finger protein draculin-like [Pectinophora gossypiella]|nr:zinc finger protein draculin-like [Pectinophora gossypiella]
MAAVKNKGPIVDPALCRCCRSIKKCRLLNIEYEWSGTKEVYSEMFMDCFGLLLSNLDGEKKDSCICATCVVRLRDACAFRSQVLSCEQVFLDARLENSQKFDVEVKTEPCGSDQDSPVDDGDDRDEDYAEPDIYQPDPDLLDSEAPKEAIGLRTRSKARGKTKVGKRDLMDKMQRLKNKLDRMLDKPETKLPAPKKAKPPQKIVKSEPDHQDMVYSNAVTMIINSYLCPFQNRISNYYCYYCRDQFTNPVELREHTLTHDPKKDFESMMENKKIPKIDVTRIDCRLCSDKIGDLPTLRSHLSTVHSLKMYEVTNEFLTFKLSLDSVECTECGISFPYFDLLKKHMIDHFGTYICDQCGACFLEQNSLRTHIKSHSRVETFFPCEICGKNLKSKYSRYLHIATVHEKKPTVNCYKCDSCFLSYAQRNRHLIEVHGDKRTFSCKQCDKVYNRRKTLMEHMRRNHLKVFRHQCDLCDQRFYLPSRLKEHMATHTGERNFRCEFCDKSYPRLQSLQEHIRSHSNERRYKKTSAGFDMETTY